MEFNCQFYFYFSSHYIGVREPILAILSTRNDATSTVNHRTNYYWRSKQILASRSIAKDVVLRRRNSLSVIPTFDCLLIFYCHFAVCGRNSSDNENAFSFYKKICFPLFFLFFPIKKFLPTLNTGKFMLLVFMWFMWCILFFEIENKKNLLSK